MSDHTYNREKKLKSRKAIQDIFAKRNGIHSFPILLFWRIDNEATQSNLQVGVSVSKKKFKNAVDRNHVKRKMREAWRLNQHKLDQFVHENEISLQIMFVFTGHKLEDANKCETSIKILSKKAIKSLPITNS